MIDPIRNKVKLLAAVSFAFLFGLGLASGLEWTRGSHAAPSLVLNDVESSVTLPARTQVQGPAELSEAFIATAQAVTPAVVRIEAERMDPSADGRRLPPALRDFFGQPPRGEQRPLPQVAGGSGFVVSADGYILTNNHVVEGADRISVVLVDQRTFPAEIVGRDPTTDLAVIRIDASGLPTARLGNSDRARVGEWVLAIGNPGFVGGSNSTLAFTMTSGIISAKGRSLNIISRELYQDNSAAAGYAIEDFIQTDAVINPGNSGGPLVNLRGEVIGVSTAIASPTGFYQGYGFAIPINLVRRVMEDLVQNGHVRRALLGITIKPVTPEDAEVYDLPEIAGVLVQDFSVDGSPAQQAGLERHDVIVDVDGHPVERVGQLQRVIAQREPGTVVEVGVIRYGTPHTFRVELAAAPIPESPEREAPRADARGDGGIGIEVVDLTGAVARQHGFDDADGAVVSNVRPMSPAARKGVQRDSRIVSIDRQPISSAREAEAALRRAAPGDVVSLLLESADGRT